MPSVRFFWFNIEPNRHCVLTKCSQEIPILFAALITLADLVIEIGSSTVISILFRWITVIFKQSSDGSKFVREIQFRKENWRRQDNGDKYFAICTGVISSTLSFCFNSQLLCGKKLKNESSYCVETSSLVLRKPDFAGKRNREGQYPQSFFKKRCNNTLSACCLLFVYR